MIKWVFPHCKLILWDCVRKTLNNKNVWKIETKFNWIKKFSMNKPFRLGTVPCTVKYTVDLGVKYELCSQKANNLVNIVM